MFTECILLHIERMLTNSNYALRSLFYGFDGSDLF